MNPSIAKTSKSVDYSKLHRPEGMYLHGYFIKLSSNGYFHVKTEEGTVKFTGSGYDCWQWVLTQTAMTAEEKEKFYKEEIS